MKGICSRSIVAYFICVSTFISACSTKTDPGSIVIEGKIIPSKDRKVYLYGYANDTAKYKGVKTILDSAEISVRGKYFISHTGSAGYLFDLRTNDSIRVTNLFLKPGDQLTLNFIKGAHHAEIPDDDPCSKYNNYLVQFIDSFYTNPGEKKMYYVASNYLILADYQKFTAQRKQKMLQFYDDYFKNDPPDSLFANLAISEINYQYGNDNLLFLWKRRMRGQKAIDDSTSYDFLKLLQIENPHALNSPAYYYFLHLYINDLYNQEIEQGTVTAETQDVSGVAAEKKHLAEKNLTGKFREIAEWNIDESLGKN